MRASLRATLGSGLSLALSDAYCSRRAFLADAERPVPWVLLGADVHAAAVRGATLGDFQGSGLREVRSGADRRVVEAVTNSLVSLAQAGVPLGQYAEALGQERAAAWGLGLVAIVGSGGGSSGSGSGGGAGGAGAQRRPSAVAGSAGGASSGGRGGAHHSAPVFRDKDAPQRGAITSAKPNYGASIVSYEDI